MKFGRQFHRRVVPKWDQHYIDYNVIKRLLKTSVFTDSQPGISGLLILNFLAQLEI